MSEQRLSKEDQAAQRIADRQEQLRADRLLADGLRRLREGRAPTPTQLPFVQRWLLGQDNQIQALKEAADRERIDKESAERIYSHLVSKWNAVMDVLRELGIELYAKADHGWQGQVGESKGGQEGYGSMVEALKAALEWRIKQR